MSAAKHTPGPWMVAAGPSSIVGWPVVAQKGQSICSLSWIDRQPDWVADEAFAAYRAEVHANGHLIAAAPDLHKACADWIAYLDDDSPHSADRERQLLDAMRAAVAKVEGRA